VTAELNARKLQPKHTFAELYTELAAIDVRDVDMLRQLGTSAKRMRDLMQRHGHRPSLLLNQMATEEEGR